MIIQNEADLSAALAFIEKNEVLAYDTETTGLNPRKDRIIGFGFSNSTFGYYFPILTWTENKLRPTNIGTAENISKMLSSLSSKRLLMFNASFDARFTKYNFGVDLVPALHADVLLMKHTCDEEFPFGLKELATKHWGTDVKKEKEEMLASIKQNEGTAKEYFKASTEVLARYCVQDCLLTFKLYNHYSRDLELQHLGSFYYRDEVLPLYKEVTIPMEEAGIKLDLALLNTSYTEIKEDLARVEEKIQSAISMYLDAVFVPWLLNKDYPLATYTGRVPAWRSKYKTQFEAWLADVTSSNPDKPNYMFNLLSKHHLKKLFFDTLKEVPLSRTPKGAPQVDEEFLELMGQKYEWAKDLITYNKLIKLKGAYIERFLEEHEDGIFYPSFQQHRTVSGRYSGDLQQLPRPLNENSLTAKYTNRIRSFFISDNSSVLMSADYEQLEPRTFCHVSGDVALADIFNTGKDFYSEIARMVEGCSEVSKAQRQKAKSYALGIPYGMTGYKLKFEIECGQEEADALVERYLSSFPGLRAWMNVSRVKAIEHGQVSSELGRVRRLGRIKQIRDKYGPCIEDDLQLWKQLHEMPALYERAKAERREYKNYINNAINFQIQSMAASIMNRASIAIARALKSQGLASRIVAQVHDELVLHVPNSEQQHVAALVKDAMENTTKLSVPLLTTPQCATNYRDCK